MTDTLDVDIYRNYNDDLASLSDEQLQEHFRNFHEREPQRITCQKDIKKFLKKYKFDVKLYRKENADLVGTDEDLVKHFVKYGHKEPRKGSIIDNISPVELSDADMEYVRTVEFKRVKGNVKDLVGRIVDNKNVLVDSNINSLAAYLIKIVERTDSKATSETKRYLFGLALPLCVDVLYWRGELFFDDYIKLRREAEKSVGLFDKFFLEVTSSLGGCC